MKLFPALLCLAFLGLVFTSPAHAYLDPGTGSMVFQAAIALFLGAAATGKLWWHKVKGLFSGKSSRKSDGNEQ